MNKKLSVIHLALLYLLIIFSPINALKAQSNQEIRTENALEKEGFILIKGVVLDEEELPIPGVFIKSKVDEKNYSITNSDGAFSISTFPDDVLTFEFLGMKSLIVNVDGKKSFNLVMHSEAMNLADVVITGYQTLSKGRSTGSFEIITEKDLGKIVSTDVADKLEGAVAGLLVDQDGEMLIRGKGSIYAETKPLLVVDGFPMEYGSSQINPNDIAQISVLKDAAASSIWGVRAANGVIVITTKQGKKNQPTRVTYTGNIKIGDKKDLGSLGYGTAAQQVNAEWEFMVTNPTSVNTASIENNYSSYSEAKEIYYRHRIGEYTADQMKTKFTELGSYDNLEDISREFYQQPIIQQHNIALSGGSENSSNYFSLNYENNLGDLIGNTDNKVNIQFNNSIDVFKWLKASIGVRGNYANADIYNQNPLGALPYVRFRDTDGGYATEYRTISQMGKDKLATMGYLNWDYNRIQDREMINNNSKSYNLASNLKLDFKLPYNFTFSTSGMYAIDNAQNSLFYAADSYYSRDLMNRFTSVDNTTGKLTKNFADGGVRTLTDTNSYSYSFRNVLSYNNSWDNIRVSAQGGTDLFAVRTFVSSDTYFGYDPQGMTYDTSMNLGQLLRDGITGYHPGQKVKFLPWEYAPYQTDLEDRYFSLFFTGNVSFYDKYTVFGSIRYDQTNLYGASSKYRDQPTWSAGGKWAVSQEKFFKSSIINDLSLKASYGLSGNIDKTTSPYLIAKSVRGAVTGLRALIVNNPANPDLGWEKVYTFNTGVELSMFDSRLNISAEYYHSTTNDALGYSVLDPTTGWPSVLKNTASLINTGIDLTISGNIIENTNFNWFSSVNFSYNYNEVTKVNSGDPTLTSIEAGNAIIGKPVDYIYAYDYTGLDVNGDPQVRNAEGELLPDSAISSFGIDDLLFLGRRSPPVFGGWSNSVNYKGFALDILFTYKLGHYVRMPEVRYRGSGRINEKYDLRWREAGDENTTWVPRDNFNEASPYRAKAVNFSQMRTERGDIIRLKTIGISYDFKSLIKTDLISALNLRFSVENLAKWVANSENLDSDSLYIDSYVPGGAYSENAGVYRGSIPTYYTFSLNITL